MSANYDLTPYDPTRETDFWSDTPGSTLPAPGGPQRHVRSRKDHPMDKVKRLFRGRMALAVVLGLVGAVIGAALGWMSQTPTYMAGGYIEIQPVVQRLSEGADVIPQYRQFMTTQAKNIEHVPMAQKAMEQEAWTQVVDAPIPPAVFASWIDARHSQQDNTISISFEHEDPQVAIAGATAVIDAYVDGFLDRRAAIDALAAERLGTKKTDLIQRRNKTEAALNELKGLYGGVNDLSGEYQALIKERDELAAQLRRIEAAQALAQRAKDRALNEETQLSIVELAEGDLALQSLLDERAILERNQLDLRATQGENSNAMRRLASDLVINQTQIEQQAQKVRQSYFGTMPNLEANVDDPGMINVTADYVFTLESRRGTTSQRLTAVTDELEKVAADQVTLAGLTAELKTLEEQIELIDERVAMEQQNAQYQGELGTIAANPPAPGTAMVSEDKRAAMAIGGAMMGFALPIGIILLLGLTDSRFRYSDDAAEASEKVTLLGILPNLPDRLSDPNQASIAAHCVHQIRTILQINHGSDEPRAFSITSAQRGDGKTSLALALGLSYAASGCRTLLVDTDLQHGGLSTRLGVTGDEGIMDAITGGELLEFVCETDVQDLAILPIGKASANHAGAFSPAAMRHLLEQAKRHFDVIICDSGPILGSIEATPVAAAVNGVLLTVSRGQSRPLVSKALNHLDGVGATVSGLVFNRAQASDFERSVSGMNLRSGVGRLPAQNGSKNGARNGRRSGSSTVLSQN